MTKIISFDEIKQYKEEINLNDYKENEKTEKKEVPNNHVHQKCKIIHFTKKTSPPEAS